MNTDRDPTDPTTLGRAVSTWLTSEPGDQAADQALVSVLLAQGVLTPEEASEAWVSDEYTGHPFVQVYVPSLGGPILVVVDENGEVQAQHA